MLTDEKSFMICEKCGKRIIERQPNGLFHFMFGRKKDKEGNLLSFLPVEIYIHGSIRIRCLSRTCGHWNVFNYFPSEVKQSGFPEPIQDIFKRREVSANE
jgi:hypothetical protein